MSAPDAISFGASPSAPAEPLPRCCPFHGDWATLAEHLLDDFSDVAVDDVVRELRRAKDAVDGISLAADEALAVGELIARHQLMVLAGRISDVARLDPERHVRSGG